MKHEYLNKFKYLLKINYREDDCFTYFLKDLKIIISGLEQEIYDNYLNNDESIFLRYASKQAKDLKRCLDNSENIQAEDIIDYTAKEGLAERFAKRFGQVVMNIVGGPGNIEALR